MVLKEFHVDTNDCLQLQKYGDYEKEERVIFGLAIKPGYTVVDVGAHIGFHTLFLSQLVGPAGRVFAFEPEPSNFALLSRNIKLSDFNNVTLEQKAVSNVNGPINLYLNPESSGDHRIMPTKGRESIEVESVRLVDYFRRHVDFVKMDIQGAEMSAMLGMEWMMKNDNLKMVVEFWPWGIKESGHDPEEFMHLIDDFGFEMYDVQDKQHLLPFMPEPYFELFFTNLYLYKGT